MIPKPCRGSPQQLHDARGSLWVYRSQEFVKPDQIGSCLGDPADPHQRGSGAGNS
jgi:hypothetical protein